MLGMRLFKDISLSAVTAGFVAVLVGFTSSVAIVFQAAQAFQATPGQLSSWMWALGWGMGLCSLLPSLWWRKPVMVAWSTPGAAVLATAGLAGHFDMADAVGAFMVCAALCAAFDATVDASPSSLGPMPCQFSSWLTLPSSLPMVAFG